MASERFRPPQLLRVLVDAAERRRPGLGAWSPQVRETLLGIFREELAAIRPAWFELSDDAAYWEWVERLLLDDAFPRYAALAERRSELEGREFGLWRGGDLMARAAYAVGGFALGFILVKTPAIPIPTTWDFLIFAMALAGPLVPDWQVSFHDRRYARSLEQLGHELQQAEADRRAYAPLTGLSTVVPVASEAPISDSAAPEKVKE